MGLPPIECPFDIPKPFRWNESFKVFYQNLDDEHRGLFDVVFDVDAKRGDAGAVSKAASAFKGHFTTEEAEMKKGVDAGKLDGAHYKGHCTAHNKFLELFGSFGNNLGDDEINYSMKWLVNHIKSTDFHYKGKLIQ
ncbi:hemerythrin-like protein [Nematostella vectensis]|uniref:hemerythrin-like protein n=1 Tax=Nematostella vectensis TaxID=45351 RepID=UPI00138FABF7|nr:hemerythrin-like protein [Nematostella vectensis]